MSKCTVCEDKQYLIAYNMSESIYEIQRCDYCCTGFPWQLSDGQSIRTKAITDDDALILFTHNNQESFSKYLKSIKDKI